MITNEKMRDAIRKITDGLILIVWSTIVNPAQDGIFLRRS